MTSDLTAGSLCTGYGGLDLAVDRVLATDLLWVSEIDRDACAVLGERFSVPNIGDLRTADPEPVDVLTAGFPCQPVSVAGRRAGVDDERWLWDDLADFVGRMDPRPRLLLFENVAGLLTANDGHAMARVVSDLAGLGFVGRWRSVRASDVGACHRRTRVFVVAESADTAGVRPEPAGSARARRSGSENGGGSVADPDGETGTVADGGPVTGFGVPGRYDVERSRLRRFAAADPDGARWERHRRPVGGARERSATAGGGQVDFGPYGDAVERWAGILGRVAPDPTTDGRLNPVFVEWMMGLPAGWVTGVAGISRSAQLRVLGNGVVPQQAAFAYRGLLGV